MPDPSDLPDTTGDGSGPPAGVRTYEDKVRFALSRRYGMGRNGEKWPIDRIADALDVSERQVYRYLNDSEIAQEVQQVLQADEAQWRLDMAVELRTEIQRLEDIEKDLLKRKKAVPTGFENKTVHGTPTGDYNVKLDDDANSSYKLNIAVPTNYEEVTDYGRDLKEVQTQKRQYWDMVADLLGLDAPQRKEVDHTLADRTEEVKIIEFRSDDDDYPAATAEPIDGDEVIDVDNVAETRQHPDDATDLSQISDPDAPAAADEDTEDTVDGSDA